MKEKSIWKLALGGYGNMLLAEVFCLILVVAIVTFNPGNFILNLILLVLTVPLYILLIYGPIWTEGDRNRNMVQFGHLEKDMTKGLKIGLLLAVPYLIWNVLLTLSKLGVMIDIFAIYRLCNAHIWPLLSWINPEVEIAALPVWGLVLCWIASFYPTVVAVIAYFLGYKGVSVWEKVLYKNKPHHKRRKF